jgi:hypothetical protein
MQIFHKEIQINEVSHLEGTKHEFRTKRTGCLLVT